MGTHSQGGQVDIDWSRLLFMHEETHAVYGLVGLTIVRETNAPFLHKREPTIQIHATQNCILYTKMCI